ncbi:unnamed protein product [Dibothriocephalus latus]|uniref:Uncharacterized protein n=1 Tax=Dibothriocephalus latus TaxID=60516 RepID=A0A3P6U1H6_DIBLA|nr:unnamed protein product [Dibothriocephalus latus]
MKSDYETEEDAEVAQYLNTALEVQPGLNWRLLALRRQASIRNGGNIACRFLGLKAARKFADVATYFLDLVLMHCILASFSFQDLRAPRRTYSFREPSERRTCSAAPNGQSNHASMQPGEKSAAQSRRVNGTAAKPEATSTLQRRLTYDPHSSKVITRPMKQSNDKAITNRQHGGPVAQELERSPLLGKTRVRNSCAAAIVAATLELGYHHLMTPNEAEMAVVVCSVFVGKIPEAIVCMKATKTTHLLSFHSNFPTARKRYSLRTVFNVIWIHCNKS